MNAKLAKKKHSQKSRLRDNWPISIINPENSRENRTTSSLKFLLEQRFSMEKDGVSDFASQERLPDSANENTRCSVKYELQIKNKKEFFSPNKHFI